MGKSSESESSSEDDDSVKTVFKLNSPKLGEKISENKSKKLKRNRSLEESMSDDRDALVTQLQAEKKNNKKLMKQLETLQKQIESLTLSVNSMNTTIQSLQAEKLEIMKPIPNQTSKNETNNINKKDNINTRTKRVNQTEENTITGIESKINENQSQNNNTNDESDAQPENVFKKSSRVTPIDVWTNEATSIQQRIIEAMPKNCCVFSRVNKSKFRIFAKTEDYRKNILKFLNERGYNFNSYLPANEKPINMIIKNSDINDINEIKESLECNGITPKDIRPYITGHMRMNSSQSKLWHIILYPNTDTKVLLNMKYIGYHAVKIEYMKKPAISQCRRCQRFNHAASACNMPYRCVKCTGNHEPGNCPTNNTNNITKPKCVNCMGEHTANDAKKCIAYQRALKVNEERKKKKNTQKSKTVKWSYADVLASSTSKEEKDKEELNDNTLRETVRNNKYIDLHALLSDQTKMMSTFFDKMMQMQREFLGDITTKNG